MSPSRRRREERLERTTGCRLLSAQVQGEYARVGNVVGIVVRNRTVAAEQGEARSRATASYIHGGLV